ncbi:MAG TPA: DUF6717 family protein [Flavisolibacter sp.]|nr:DUF6717 family protein [Flavisolibacter sp.]
MIQTEIASCNKRTEQYIEVYTFRKESGHWYIDLPEYLEQGYSNNDLEMVEGTSKLLNTISNGSNAVTLRLSTEPFKGSDILELQEHCDAPSGGAIYLMERCQGREVAMLIWICDIALFVFGDMPQQIFFQRINAL